MLLAHLVQLPVWLPGIVPAPKSGSPTRQLMGGKVGALDAPTLGRDREEWVRPGPTQLSGGSSKFRATQSMSGFARKTLGGLTGEVQRPQFLYGGPMAGMGWNWQAPAPGNQLLKFQDFYQQVVKQSHH